MSADLTAELLAVAPGHAAGYPSKGVGLGVVTAGTIVVITGGDVNTGVLAEVSFSTEDDVPTADSFAITQVTGSGLGATLAGLTVAQSNPSGSGAPSGTTGFVISAADAPTANTLYVFTYTG